MKTYVKITNSTQEERELSIEISKKTQKILADNTKDRIKKYEELNKLLKKYLNFDYMVFRYPDSDKSEFLEVYPPINDKIRVSYFCTPEQSIAVLTSQPMLRVGLATESDDTVLIHSLSYNFPIKKFSIAFWRDVVDEKYLCQVAFISKQRNAYTEKHTTLLFELGNAFRAYFKEYIASDSMITTGAAVFESSLLDIDKLPSMQNTKEMILKISRENIPILLLGETGTGKEVVANTIHRFSTRAKNTFIKINCGSIPDTLIDSELFGHEKGAFTGAVEQTKGLFERANRGMLMLDELGELPMTAQVRLLRVLQEGALSRVGGQDEFFVDVRIIAATHRNLPQLIQEGKFRQDLFYRLNLFPIIIPPLRERKEDIPILVEHFIKRRCEQKGIINPPILSQKDIDMLCSYDWPGNIRELQNLTERSLILWDERKGFSMNLAEITRNFSTLEIKAQEKQEYVPKKIKKDYCLDSVIKEHILEVLEETKWRINGKNGAAELLCVNASTLRARMKKLGLI